MIDEIGINNKNLLGPERTLILDFEDTELNSLGLSTRSFNALKAYGVRTIKEFLELDESSLYKIKNLGTKSVDEIKNIRNNLMNNNSLRQNIHTKAFYDFPAELKISDLKLSTRLKNVLSKLQVNELKDLLSISDYELLKTEDFGSKSLNEFKKLKCQYSVNLQRRENRLDQLTIENFYSFISKLNIVNDSDSELLNNYIYNTFNPENSIWEDLSKSNIIVFYIHKFLISLIKDSDCHSIEKSYIVERFSFVPHSFFDNVLLHLFENGFIKIEGENVSLFSIEEIISQENNINLKEILLERLYGYTLEEVGKKNNLTRERIRQKINVWTESNYVNILNAEEIIYLNYYQEYDWRNFKSIFSDVLGASDFCINFFDNILCVDSGTKSLEMLTQDKNLSIKKKLLLEQKLKVNEVKILGQWCKRSISDTAKLFIRYQIDKNKIYHLKELSEQYCSFIENIDSSLLPKNPHHIERIFTDCHYDTYLIRNNHNSARFYDYTIYDYAKLIDIVNSFEGAHISTLKLLNDYPSLLQDYQLNDEYELHNLLKVISCSFNILKNIVFERMPSLTIGGGSRSKQIYSIIENCSCNDGISPNEIADLYYSQYGFKQNSFLANCLFEFNHLYSKITKKYKVVKIKFSSEIYETLLKQLTKEYYSGEEFIEIFNSIKNKYCLERNIDYIDIVSCGYKFYGISMSNFFVIKNCYHSLMSYYEKIFDAEIVDISKYSSLFKSYIYNYIQMQCKTYNFIEFEKNVFLNTKKLESVGFSKDDLVIYCDSLINYLKDQNIRYFNIFFLRRSNFKDNLKQLGFESDYFYERIISNSEKFEYITIGSYKIFVNNDKNIEKEYLRKKFYTQYIPKNGIYLDELVSILKRKFGLELKKYIVVNNLDDSNLYYNKIIDRVFLSYDDFEQYFKRNIEKEVI